MSKKKQETNAGAKALDVILTLALLAGIGAGGYLVISRGVKVTSETAIEFTTEPVTEPTTEEAGIIYEAREYANTDVLTGPLILVNNSTPCSITESGLVSLYEVMLERGIESFSVRDSEVLVQPEMADALIAMLDDFHTATGVDDVLVLSGYRSKDKQKELYDEDLAATGLDYSERVSKPGFSEHQTGYGVDLSLTTEEDYDGTGDYAWIDEHCAEYGLILRYPEMLTATTGIQYEPWHYRYVGSPHASVIMNNGLCLEDYLELVKRQYPYDGEHMIVTDFDGKIYEIFYYPKDSAEDSTQVPVPSGGLSYTVFGDNVGGFIVTVDTGKVGEPVTDLAPEAPDLDEVVGGDDADADADADADSGADADAEEGSLEE